MSNISACSNPPSAPGVATIATVREPRALVRAAARNAGDASDVRPLVTLLPSDDDRITHDLAAGIRAEFDGARAAGGPDLTLRVATKTAAWGSAAGTAVVEAHDVQALAIVAPPERRHAHLLAQLATRVKLPMVSTSPARTVGAAGSTWVVSVVPTVARVGDGPPVAPTWDTPDAGAAGWVRVGRAAGRAVVGAVVRNGVRREGFVAAARAAGGDRPDGVASREPTSRRDEDE